MREVRVGGSRFAVSTPHIDVYPGSGGTRCTFVNHDGMNGSDLVGVLYGRGNLTGASTAPNGALLVGRFVVGGR